LHAALTAQCEPGTPLKVAARILFAFMVSLAVTLAGYKLPQAPRLRLKSRFQ